MVRESFQAVNAGISNVNTIVWLNALVFRRNKIDELFGLSDHLIDEQG